MVKNKPNETISQITESEISATIAGDKIARLEKERAKNKKAIDEYKEREKATARALVIYERKIKYLKHVAIDSLLEACNFAEKCKNQYVNTCESIMNFETKQQFKAQATKFDDISEKLYALCDKLEALAGITNEDRAFISNKPAPTPAPADVDSRFARLREEFDEKIGQSVLRKPGRPKRGEQSIVSDLGLGKKPGKKSEISESNKEKLNKIFYEAPTGGNVKSNIPNTSDSLFDFNEALNPNISLKDIMADLMEQKEEVPAKTYSKLPPQPERKRQGGDTADDRRARVERLEAGIFQTPIFRERKEEVEEPPKEEVKKPSFEDRFMPFKSIMDETKH